MLPIFQVDGQMLSLAFRFLRARTPEQRALVDLETHYTKVRNWGSTVFHCLNNVQTTVAFLYDMIFVSSGNMCR